MSKKLLALFLAILMVLGTIPALALASFADDPVKLGGILLGAGYNFILDGDGKATGIPYDFYFADVDNETVTYRDGMQPILEADPEIVPGTMAANLGDYTFTVTLTVDGVPQSQVVTASVKDNWGTYDQGILFDLTPFDFTPADCWVDVRIDITTPGGKQYYVVEETPIGFGGIGSFGRYGDGYEGVSYNPATLVLKDIVLLFTYGCDQQQDMADHPSNYVWVLTIDGVDYTVQPSSFYDNWLVRFKPLQWATPYVPAWGSKVNFSMKVYEADGVTPVLTKKALAVVTFPDEPTRPASVEAEEIGNSGVTWAYDSATGTLTFDGAGSIPDYQDNADREWHTIKDAIVNVVVKGGVTYVGRHACHSFNNLDKIVMEEGVTSTGFDCFAGSGTITDVYLPVSLTSMAQGGFYGCTVTNVYYTDTSRDFGERCTMGAYNTAITNANWVNDPDWGSFGDMSDTVAWAFDADTGTLTITGTGAIPSVATKPWQSYVSQITKIVIGEGITEIPGGGLFSHVDNLDRVEMPETITKIGGDAFGYNGTVSYLKLSSNVTKISQGVLYGTTVTTISCKKDWRAIQQQASVGNYNDAFGNATWVDTEIYGTYLSFTKYGDYGFENWGDPLRTQFLICPKWDGACDNDFLEQCMNVEWTFVFTAYDESFTTHLYVDTVYKGGTWGILRFVPGQAQVAAERFTPIPDMEYTVTTTVTLNGRTETVTSADKFVFPSMKDGVEQEPITYNYHTITWQIDGVTEYTEEVIDGFEPVYHGVAESYVEDNIAYIYTVTPAIVAATEDATYNFVLTTQDVREGTLALWGAGYENWTGGTGGTQTELLLRPKDWQGKDVLEAYKDYTWTITIDGVDYTGVKPSSHYSNMIFRFEPVLWTTPFVPHAGTTYQVGVKIYDDDNALVFYTTTTKAITIAADFIPVHEHDVVSWEWTAPAAEDADWTAAVTIACNTCGAQKTVDATVAKEVTEEGTTYTATAKIGIRYNDNGEETGYDQIFTDTKFIPARQNGDVNGDNEITIEDVTELLNFLKDMNDGDYDAICDVNGDNEVTIADVTALLVILSEME